MWESLIHTHIHTHTYPVNNMPGVVQHHSGMRALPFRYGHTHVEMSGTMWVVSHVHILSPPHTHMCTHTHACTEQGRPCSQLHTCVSLGFIHRHPPRHLDVLQVWAQHTVPFRQNGFHTLGCVSQMHAQ